MQLLVYAVFPVQTRINYAALIYGTWRSLLAQLPVPSRSHALPRTDDRAFPRNYARYPSMLSIGTQSTGVNVIFTLQENIFIVLRWRQLQLAG